MDIASADLARIRELYGQGQYLAAYEFARTLGPLKEWKNPAARLLGGRLAVQLGGPRLGRWLHLRAYRDHPTHPEVIYYHARYLFERRGPLACWEFFRRHPDSEWDDAAPEVRADWFALQAFVASRFRDFDRAERLLQRAEAIAAERPWLCIERSSVYEAAERWDEALAAAQRSMELVPWFRPGVQATAHLLQQFGKSREALELLRQGADRLQSSIVLAQLGALQLELGHYTDARHTYERYAQTAVLAEPKIQQWLQARRADVAYFLGELGPAAQAAAQAGEGLYADFARRLQAAAQLPTPPRCGPVMVPVELPHAPALRPLATTSPPQPPPLAGLLQALHRFWGRGEIAVQLKELPSYDGLPDCAERKWADAHGYRTVEFTLNLETALALLERGVPFLISFTDAGYTHTHLVIGADRIRESIFFRQPWEVRPTEGVVQGLLERYAAFGPRCLVLVPQEKAALLDGIDFPEAPLYDQVYRAQCAFRAFRREEALLALETMRTQFPDHRLRWQLEAAFCRHDLHPVKLLEAIDRVLQRFPNEATFLLTRLTCLRDLGRKEERLALLYQQVARLDADPIFAQHLAQTLLPYPRRREYAEYLLRRSLRRRPTSPAGYYILANLWWENRRFPEAADMYRIAASLDDRDEQFAEGYFRSMRVLDQLPEAMRFLQTRFQRPLTRHASSARTLFFSLLEQQETRPAFDVLDKARAELTTDADLWLFIAEMYAQHERFEQAEQLLSTAKAFADPVLWLRSACRIRSLQNQTAAALELCQQWLALEPGSPEAWRQTGRLMLEMVGKLETLAWLQQQCQRYPHFYPLWQMRIDFLRGESNQPAIEALRHMLAEAPNDAWARRELALHLANAEQFDEALAELERARQIEPYSPSYFYSSGHVLFRADRVQEARKAYRAALEVSVDHDIAINELMNLARSDEDREEVLQFVATLLESQEHLGDGLLTFRDQAIHHMEPEELYPILDRLLDDNPDLWQAWSVCIQQLGLLGRHDEAVELARTATERFPLLPRLWLDLAEALAARGDSEGQIEALRQAVQASPTWSLASRELSEALEQNDQVEEAKMVLMQAIARMPQDPVNHGYLADTLWNSGESELALQRVIRALKIDPGYDWAWRSLAEWSERMDCPERPIEVAREVAHSRPGDFRAWLNLARALAAPEQAEEAIAALDRAIALSPRTTEAYDLKAEKLAQLGRFDEAIAAAKPSLFEDDPPMTLQGRIAWIEAKRGNYAAAIPAMQALVAIEPNYYWGWQQLAEWYNETGKAPAYLEAASEMVRLWPDNPSALAMRGEARIQTGDRENGKEDLRQAQKLAPTYMFPGALLFDTYLADGELKQASDCLAILQEHNSGPFVLAREVQLLARRKKRERALKAFRELCTMPSESAWPVQSALNALVQAGWTEDIDPILKETWESAETFHPWVALAWVDSPSGSPAPIEEKLKPLDRAIREHPTYAQAYDYKAELLARLERFEEAEALCNAPIWKGNPPLMLRGRAAWLHAARGNRDQAIREMRQLLEQEPDYYWGWKQLAHWYDANESHSDYLEAAQNLVRLAPNDPVSYGYRGEARLYTGDRRGATEDFRKAFEMDSAYGFAGHNLFDLQLADGNLEAASETLSKLQQHIGGASVEIRALRLALCRKDETQALQHLKQLLSSADTPAYLLDRALDAMTDAGYRTAADELLWQVLADAKSDCSEYLGRVWVRRQLEVGRFSCMEQLPKLLERGKVGREALLAYVDLTGTVERSSHLLLAMTRFGDVLRQDLESWSTMGQALADAQQWSMVALWLADWKQRSEVEAATLDLLSLALVHLNRFSEAVSISNAALQLPEDDSKDSHLVRLALADALAGRTHEAQQRLEQIDRIELDPVGQFLHGLAFAAVLVQRAQPQDKAQAFAEAKEHLKATCDVLDDQPLSAGLEALYEQTVRRLSQDTGSLKAWFWRLWHRPPAQRKLKAN